ncbi:hypothetical protein D3C80_861420 [compost metagenome]
MKGALEPIQQARFGQEKCTVPQPTHDRPRRGAGAQFAPKQWLTLQSNAKAASNDDDIVIVLEPSQFTVCRDDDAQVADDLATCGAHREYLVQRRVTHEIGRH